MIIDCHGHVSAPAQLWAYKAGLLASRGSHGRGGAKVSDAEVRAALNTAEIGPMGHLDVLNDHGIDVQLISPRPFQLMHSERPAKLVHWFAEECHDIIHRQTTMHPDKFFGVASLPQAAGDPIARALPELDRCVKELGFRRLSAQSRPLREFGRRAARARRSLLVPAIRKAVRARHPGTHPYGELSLRARELFRPPDQRGHDRDPGASQLRCVQGFPKPENHRFARRRVHSVSTRTVRRTVAAWPRRNAVPRPIKAALFRYGAVYGTGARTLDQDRRPRSLLVRFGMPRRWLCD